MTRAGLVRLSIAFVASVCMSGLVASAQAGANRFSTVLAGDQEVPVVATIGGGTLTLDVNEGGTEIDWELTYSDMQADVIMAHIHVAQPGVNGGIVLWFCKTTQTAPAGTQTCPTREGTLSGTFTNASVTPVASQQIPADLHQVVALIKDGFGYANVHTTASTGGEIRGQIKPGSLK
jgi:hypothetical protein